MKHFATKAKAYVSLAGAILTAAAGVVTDSKPLALAAAVITAAAVYWTPNANEASE